MRPNLLAWTLAIAIGFASLPNVFANCGLTLSASNISISWNQSYNFQAVTFTVGKTKGSACNYVITFTPGGASDYNRRMTSGANQLRYQLYKDSGLTQVLMDAPTGSNPTNYITGNLQSGNGRTATLTYYVQIPQDLASTPSYKPNGSYADTFTIKAYDSGDLASLVPDTTSQINITTTVPKFVDLSLVGPGGSFDEADTAQTLNFGTLTEGSMQSFDMRVRYNSGFTVTFSSQNNGVLKQSNPAVTTTVPYTLQVNSVTKDLSNSATTPVSVANGSGQTSDTGVANPVTVTIGSITDKMAGSYSDNITVTAASN